MPMQYTRTPRRVPRVCDHCGAGFTATLSRIAAGGGRFCARSCKDAARRRQRDLVCQTCGVTFSVRASRVVAGAKYCSLACARSQDFSLRAKPLIERVLAKINKDGPVPEYRPDLGPCWIWTGFIDKHGYGQITVGRPGQTTTARTHRIIYEALVGPIPAGLEPDHLCRVHPCGRPDHLEPVTRRENVRRGVSMGAINGRKTHCVNGHPFDEANTIRRSNGGRDCRICARAAWRKYGAKRQRARDRA